MDDADPALQFFEEGKVDLYAALGVTKKATSDEIKKAYRKQALLHHPDKQGSGSGSSGDDAAASSSSAAAPPKATKFQQIGFAYSVLSSESRRSRYDTTGRTDESMFEEGMDWNAYFKEMWTGEVNTKTLEDFKIKYRKSEEERQDIIKAYKTVKGSFTEIFDHVPFLSFREDRMRVMGIIHNAIIDKECKSCKLWEKTKWDEKLHASAAKKEEKEEQEAMEMAKEMGVYDELFGDKKGNANGAKAKKRKQGNDKEEEDFSALQNIIAKRNEQRGGQIDGLIAKLEADAKKAKTAKKQKKGSTKADEEKEQHEPSEEQFEKIRAQLDASKSKSKKQRKA